MIQNQEYIQEFVDEAKGHIETLESILIRVDDMKSTPELINEVFRAVHSIKGTAGFFGLKNIVGLSHAMENVFGEIRNGKLAVDDELADLMLKSNDCLTRLIDDVGGSEGIDIRPCLDDMAGLLKNAARADTRESGAEITLRGGDGKEITLGGSSAVFIKDGVSQGHLIYEIKLRFNRDLLKTVNGPMRLFKNIQKIGQLVDTMVDHSEINSFDDVLASISGEHNDVYLGIIVTTGLSAARLSDAIQIPEENIVAMEISAPGRVPAAVSPADAGQAGAAVPAPAPAAEAAKPREASGKPHARHAEPQMTPIKVDDSIRVNVEILNDLLNMASEMVLGRNQLLRLLENYKKSIPGLAPVLQNVDRLTSGLQEKIMQTRMQPVANVFNKFPRIIRDISKKLGKEIELKIEGADVELDKSMIEALGDPLTHLVRNAADHGLECPDKREESGKSRIGNILLKAYHEGGFVNIDVSDDGQGLNAEKILDKAVANGLVAASEIAKMSEQEIFKLIFRPGFSTADKVTDISGRGVGMDVVKTNVEKLGGSIEIYSSKGKGTTIRLVLPLTLAIIQSLVVETGGQIFALPQVNMQEIVRIKDGGLPKIEHINGADVIRLRGKLLPVICLADTLNMPKGQEDGAGPEASIIIVIKIGAIRFGIAVHSIVESEETLVKPLPQALKGCICYSGVTIMGDGKAAMILDPEGMIKSANLSSSAGLLAEEQAIADASDSVDTERQNLLLFQCSGNETFALDMSLVARVEEIGPQQIERVGDREFLQYRSDTLRILRPEDFLPVNREELTAEKMYVIIPRLVAHPMGILVRRIVDNVKTAVRLNTDDLRVKGLLGSTLYNDRLVLLLQLYELFGLADPEHYSSEPKKDVHGYRILLAEDTPFFQRVTREYLEDAGCSVAVAPNGKDAWECLNEEHFDAVISDINMPVMDGLELVSRIKDNSSLAHIPVIALTSLSGEKNETRGISSGFDYYENKLDRDRLLSTLELALNKKNGGEIAC